MCANRAYSEQGLGACVHGGHQCTDAWHSGYSVHHLGGYWFLEPEPDDRLGLGHYQLRMVDRDWSCRNTDLCNSSVVQTEMENRGQPCGRGHDHICRFVRRAVPGHTRRPDLGGFLFLSLSQHARSSVAKLQLAAALGPFCDQHLLYCIPAFLVYRTRT